MKTIKTFLLLLVCSWAINLQAQIPCGITQPYFYTTLNPNNVPVFHDTSMYAAGWAPIGYFWDFGDGSSSNLASPSHVYTQSGTYTVCMYVTAQLQGSSITCVDTFCKTSQYGPPACGNANASFNVTNPSSGVVVLSSNSTGTSSNTLYQWWMDGSPLGNPSNSNATFTYSGVSQGTHNFCLYLYGGNANTFCDSTCNTFVVNGSTPCGNVNASFSSTSGNGTLSVQSNSTNVPLNANYQWFISGPFSGSTPPSAGLSTYQWGNLPSGTYNVCLYIWANNTIWCDSTCSTVVVQNSNPCAGLNAQYSYSFLGNVYTFNGTSPNFNVQSYWTVNGVGSGQGSNFTYTFPTDSNTVDYTVCYLLMIPGTNCIDTMCNIISVPGVNANPCSNFAVSFTQSGTPGSGYQLSAVATGGSQPYQYVWSNGVTTAGTFITTAGVYCVTAYDNNQCSAQFCDSAGINSGCNLTVVINPQIQGAFGVLYANVTGGTAPYSYIWSNGVSTSNILTINQPGTYCVSVFDANNCVGTACYTFTGPAGTDTICGVVFNDLNGNGVQDVGESGIAGAYIYIGNYSVYTDSFGYYSTTVPAGSYDVFYCAPQGNIYTVPVSSVPGGLNNCPLYVVNISGSGGTHCGYNFGIQNTSVTICGTIFYDANNNGSQDAGESGVPNTIVYITGSGVSQYAYTSQSGSYCVNAPAGTYTVTMSSNSLQTCVAAPQSRTVAATTVGQSYSGNNFAIYCQPGACNLAINVTPHTTVTAGFPAWYDIQVCNVGASVSTGATVNFFYDQALVFDNASPVQNSHNASTRTVSWNLGALTPGSCRYYWVYFDALTSIQLNQHVFTLVNVTPGSSCNDINMTNNVDTVHQYVTGSWDPNNKLAYTTNVEDNPAQHWVSSVETNQRIEYVVNFQNTGNAPAVNVVIIDEIASDLDANSFEMLGSSHPCNVTRTGSMLNFQFPQIMLPDSTNDEPNSHGFVKFAVNALNNLSAGTLIQDEAAIYFDFNAPVITNKSEVLLIEPNGFGDESVSSTVTIAPNPMHTYAEIRLSSNHDAFTFEVTDLMGRIVSSIQSETGTLYFDRNNLASGVYAYRIIQNGKSTARGKLVID